MKQIYITSDFLGIQLRLIYTACKQLLKKLKLSDKKKSEMDFVSGLPGKGTMLAVLLAIEIKKPLLVKYGPTYYSIDIEQVREFINEGLTPLMKSVNFIAGTSDPLSMIVGILMAQGRKKTFIFVPRQPRIVLDKKRTTKVAILINHSTREGSMPIYTEEAIITLKDLGIDALKLPERNTDYLLKKVDITGKKIYTFGRGGVGDKKWFKKFR